MGRLNMDYYRNTLSMKLVCKLSLVIFMIMLLSACINHALPDSEADSNNTESVQDVTEANKPELIEPEIEEPPMIVEPQPYTKIATLIAVGDIMAHSPQLTGAYDADTKTYAFDHYFTEIIPYLSGDWVIGNLETTL